MWCLIYNAQFIAEAEKNKARMREGFLEPTTKLITMVRCKAGWGNEKPYLELLERADAVYAMALQALDLLKETTPNPDWG